MNETLFLGMDMDAWLALLQTSGLIVAVVGGLGSA